MNSACRYYYVDGNSYIVIAFGSQQTFHTHTYPLQVQQTTRIQIPKEFAMPLHGMARWMVQTEYMDDDCMLSGDVIIVYIKRQMAPKTASFNVINSHFIRCDAMTLYYPSE